MIFVSSVVMSEGFVAALTLTYCKQHQWRLKQPTVCREQTFIKIQNFLKSRPSPLVIACGYVLSGLLTLRSAVPSVRCCLVAYLERDGVYYSCFYIQINTVLSHTMNTVFSFI